MTLREPTRRHPLTERGSRVTDLSSSPSSAFGTERSGPEGTAERRENTAVSDDAEEAPPPPAHRAASGGPNGHRRPRAVCGRLPRLLPSLRSAEQRRSSPASHHHHQAGRRVRPTARWGQGRPGQPFTPPRRGPSSGAVPPGCVAVAAAGGAHKGGGGCGERSGAARGSPGSAVAAGFAVEVGAESRGLGPCGWEGRPRDPQVPPAWVGCPGHPMVPAGSSFSLLSALIRRRLAGAARRWHDLSVTGRAWPARCRLCAYSSTWLSGVSVL